jgi:hypothetical protein
MLIGLAPAEAKNGDVLCLISGASLPLLLRNRRVSRGALVGSCYVETLNNSSDEYQAEQGKLTLMLRTVAEARN